MEASELVESRTLDYGDPSVTYDKVSRMWTILTGGRPIRTGVDIMLIHILSKLVRFVHSQCTHLDSIVDVGGYSHAIEMEVIRNQVL